MIHVSSADARIMSQFLYLLYKQYIVLLARSGLASLSQSSIMYDRPPSQQNIEMNYIV